MRSAEPFDTPIWKLEAALICRACHKDRHAPPVHMVKLTETREITPYSWTHPDDDDRRIGPTNHDPLSGKPASAVALPKRRE